MATNTKAKNIIIRLAIVNLCATFWFIYRHFYSKTIHEWTSRYCFEDKLLREVFHDLTMYISQNLNIRDILTITGSNLLDVFVVSFMFVYVLNGKSWKPFLHLGMFYALRGAIIQSVFLLEFYDTLLFANPGFPSLIVPFDRAPDFFYSGHVGCALIVGLSLHDMGYNEMFWVGLILAIYEAFVMTVLRAHYSIDVIFGLLVAHYLYFVAGKLSPWIDKMIPICYGTNHTHKNERELQNFEGRIETEENKQNEKVEKVTNSCIV